MDFFAIDLFNIARLFELYGEDGAKLALESVESGRCDEATIEKYIYSEKETKAQYIDRYCKENFGEHYVGSASEKDLETLQEEIDSFLRSLIIPTKNK